MELDAISLILLALAIPASFIVSAAAGLGGSLILVPAMMMAIGTKEGIAVAALLLACNNVAKVAVYRKTLPLRASGTVIIAVMLGTALGATLMLKLPELWIRYAVALVIAVAIPGPGVIALVARSLGSGYRPTLPMLFGMALGDVAYLTAAVLGLAYIASTFGLVFTIIRYLGAAYLLFIAWKFLRAKGEASQIQNEKIKMKNDNVEYKIIQYNMQHSITH